MICPRVPEAHIKPDESLVLYPAFVITGKLIKPIVTTVAPTIPVDAANNAPTKITEIPKELVKYNLEIDEEHMSLIYTYNVGTEKTGITNLLQDLKDTGLKLRDLKTEQSTLEKIFVNLVKENNEI